MVRSTLAILSGYLLVASARFPYLFLRRFVAQEALPQPGWFLAHVLLSVACGAVSGYITASVARRNELRHAFAVTALVVSTGIIFLQTEWDLPLTWYHGGLFLLMVPSILLGALFRQISRRPSYI